VARELTDTGGFTLLHTAAMEGKAQCLQRLLTLAPQDVDWKTDPEDPEGDDAEEGYTPLQLALQHGHAECARALLKAGASPSLPSGPGRQLPVHVAAQRCDDALLSMLLDAGADVNGLDGDFATALMLAAAAPSPAAARPAADAADGGAASSWMDKAAVLTLLLEWGADAALKTRGNRTALHEAVDAGCAPSVEALLKGGASASMFAADDDKNTPLSAAEAAAERGSPEVLKVLDKWRAKPVAKWAEYCEYQPAGSKRLEAMDGASACLRAPALRLLLPASAPRRCVCC
jgi:ankyrin repeat protein